MAIDQTDIEKVAVLARLQLDPKEIPELTKRIASILHMVDQMQSVDTRDIEPMANPLDARQRLRADNVSESNDIALRDEYQTIAPATQDGLYLVPKVID